jgi:hypothetical protein
MFIELTAFNKPMLVNVNSVIAVKPFSDSDKRNNSRLFVKSAANYFDVEETYKQVLKKIKDAGVPIHQKEWVESYPNFFEHISGYKVEPYVDIDGDEEGWIVLDPKGLMVTSEYLDSKEEGFSMVENLIQNHNDN